MHRNDGAPLRAGALAPPREFCSVGARGVGLVRGRWYYEVRVSSPGVAQIGWASQRFRGSAGAGEGVGDDLHSWAFDGARLRKWHGLDEPFGRTWAAGDVVCCALDCDAGRILFGLNGDYACPLGSAFEGIDCEREGGLFPAASFNAASAPGHGDAAAPQRLQFNFGSAGAEHSASWAGGRSRAPLSAAGTAALPIVGAAPAPPARAFAFGPPPGFRPLHYAFREARVAQFGRAGTGVGAGGAPASDLPQPLEDETFLALAAPASAALADDRLSHDVLFEAVAVRVPHERQMARELQVSLSLPHHLLWRPSLSAPRDSRSALSSTAHPRPVPAFPFPRRRAAPAAPPARAPALAAAGSARST